MAEPAPEKLGITNDDPAGLLLEIARGEAAEALRVSEMLDAKARSLPQVATVFFAASQAAVTIIIASVSGVPMSVTVLAGVLGLAGLFAVSACLFLAVKTQAVDGQSALKVGDIRDYVEAETKKGNEPPIWLLVGTFTQIVEDRREKNNEKADAVERAQRAGFVAIGLTSLQLLLGIVASMLGAA